MMKTTRSIHLWLLVTALLTVALIGVYWVLDRRQQKRAIQEQAINEFAKLGGEPVVNGTRRLRGLTNLQIKELSGNTIIQLQLTNSRISDAGLVHLQGID